MFEKLREEVRLLREVYQDYFKTPIPILDETGKLVKPEPVSKPKKKKL